LLKEKVSLAEDRITSDCYRRR